MLINNKVNYNREIVREYFNKHELRVKNYCDIETEKFIRWLDNIKNDDDIKEVHGFHFYITDEPGGGCTSEYNIISIKPYLEREENDDEYNKRIDKEEKELQQLEEMRKLKEQFNKEYLKDMEEYKRIKKKYNLW